MALHLLRSCVSICKINHLLRTVPPEFASEQWTRFDNGLRLSLGRITHTSVPDRAWTQATLPCRMGGLGLHESRTTQKAAFLGSCNFSKPLCHRLLGGELRDCGTPLVGEETARTALLEDDLELNNVDLGKVDNAICRPSLTPLASRTSTRTAPYETKHGSRPVLHPMPRLGCGQSQLHHLASPCRDMSWFCSSFVARHPCFLVLHPVSMPPAH